MGPKSHPKNHWLKRPLLKVWLKWPSTQRLGIKFGHELNHLVTVDYPNDQLLDPSKKGGGVVNDPVFRVGFRLGISVVPTSDNRHPGWFLGHLFFWSYILGCFLKMKPTTMGFPTKNDHFGVWNGGNFYILLLYWLLVYSIVLVKKIWCLATLLGTDSCIWMRISTCKEFQFRLMESPLPGTFWNNFLTVRVVEAWR